MYITHTALYVCVCAYIPHTYVLVHACINAGTLCEITFVGDVVQGETGCGSYHWRQANENKKTNETKKINEQPVPVRKDQ